MDWMDETVRRAAPRALGAESAAAQQAEGVARAVVAAESRKPARGSRLRKLMAGSVLGVSILGLGVTAAAAGPAIFDWVGWSPDVVAQRTFDLGDGSDTGLCEVIIRVETIYDTGKVGAKEADRRADEARKFLTGNDWDPLISSITADEIKAEYALDAARRASSTTETMTPPPATMSGTASQLMMKRVSEEFEQAGFLRPGVALQAAGRCGETTEGPTP